MFVYDYVADFPRHVEWNHQPSEMVQLTDGPVRVGSQFQTKEQGPSNQTFGQKVMFIVLAPVVNMMYGSSGHTVAEITALEPNERVAWSARLPSKRKGDLMRMNWEIELHAHNGATEVVQRCQVAPPDSSPFARMVNEDMAKQSQDEVSANLERTKSIIEGR